MEKKRDLILFVNNATKDNIENVLAYARQSRQKLGIAVIRDSKKKIVNIERNSNVDVFLSCDIGSPSKIAKTLLPYQDRLLAIVCRGEAQVPFFAKITPHVPYLRAPTSESLKWATDKVMMRELFSIYDKRITPKFKVIGDSTKKTLEVLKNEVGFPMIIKPAELASSLLVNICYHKEELEDTLRKAFRKIKKIYKENGRHSEPKILAEEFMEGDMYSVDAYVNSRGKIWFCPLVYVKTGKQIGFDDFFGYMRMTPTQLSKISIEDAQEAAKKGVRALGLRSTTVHVELMKTEKGWKVIEIGPRIGGFRHVMYNLSFGINHSLNDVLIRIPKKPAIPKKVKGYTAVLQFFSKKEGMISKIKGIKKIKNLESFYHIKQNKKVGDRAVFAKNGGKSVCDLTLFNKDRSKLLADVRRAEKMLVIEV
ncbi:MAG TPA: ATP-grasp domain-containing protein [Candidatus Pacearchaeota archaeon]|nr:ATP-grasp domain-containing protein [Candidatus Pacearchaeota archaeon]